MYTLRRRDSYTVKKGKIISHDISYVKVRKEVKNGRKKRRMLLDRFKR